MGPAIWTPVLRATSQILFSTLMLSLRPHCTNGAFVDLYEKKFTYKCNPVLGYMGLKTLLGTSMGLIDLDVSQKSEI